MARKDFVEQWNAPEAIAGRRLAGRMAHARERARDFMKECTRTERSLCVALACRLDSSPRPPDPIITPANSERERHDDRCQFIYSRLRI